MGNATSKPPPNPLSDPRRRDAEARVAAAERARRAGNYVAARSLFLEAAELEAAVASSASIAFPRARSAIAIAAVALFHRANELARAKEVACRFLAEVDGLTPEGRADLKSLAELCSRHMGLP